MIVIFVCTKNKDIMADVGIETTQNVRINFQLASVGERISASLLDILFLFVVYLIVILFSSLLGDGFVWGMLFMIPLLFYSLLFEVFMNGQTPGKKIMKIKVSTVDGSAPAFSPITMQRIPQIP